MIKCYYGFNHYATQDKQINYGLLIEEYLRCSKKETWKHVIQCQFTFETKVDFIIELKQKLIDTKNKSMSNEEISTIIHDIRMFLVGQDNFKSNQQFIGFEALFRGYIITD